MAETGRAGTVTFLFTDVEGSTRLLKQLRDRYGSVLAEHQRLLREAFAAHGGEEVDTQGDAFFYVFARARDAARPPPTVSARSPRTTGRRAPSSACAWACTPASPSSSDEGRYHGMGVHRTARIMAAGHGGQILASQSTASVLADDDLDGITLRDLGEHNLKDLAVRSGSTSSRWTACRQDFAPLKTEVSPHRRRCYRRPLVIGAFAGVVAAAIAIPVFAFGGGSGGSSLSALSANSVGVVDRRRARSKTRSPTCRRRRVLAASEDAIWVTSADTNSVSRIDASSHELRQTISVGDGPTGSPSARATSGWRTPSAGRSRASTRRQRGRRGSDSSRQRPDRRRVRRGLGLGDERRRRDRLSDRSGDRKSRRRSTSEHRPRHRRRRRCGLDQRQRRRTASSASTGDERSDADDRRRQRPERASHSARAPSGSRTLSTAPCRESIPLQPGPGDRPGRREPGRIRCERGRGMGCERGGRTIARLEPRDRQVADVVRTVRARPGSPLAGSLWVAAQAGVGTHRGGTLVVDQPVDTRTSSIPRTAYKLVPGVFST